MTIRLPEVTRVVGVDFSGARRSGLTAWMAQAEVVPSERLVGDTLPRLRLVSVRSLADLAGGEEREQVNRHLVEEVLRSERALWGFDFPFGLPIELGLGSWLGQLRHVRQFEGTAQEYGRFLVGLTREVAGVMHLRRLTDRETRTPFDCYHYRIIHQTFHGMRDVLGPIAGDRQTCVLPFQFARLREGRAVPDRVVMEACPSSTLKRLDLPYRLYKQTGRKRPDESQRDVRRQILMGIRRRIELTPAQVRLIMANPGGDALDAVIAAVGVWDAWLTDDHLGVAGHPRYRREGRVYA